MQILDYKLVRPSWNLPAYPPYHTGLYLEEYFFKRYLEDKHLFDEIGATLIPIFWTSCYMQGVDVQPYINALPTDTNYFTVSQHDDAVKEHLPLGTIKFCAGGNAGGIPIPLICSPMQITNSRNDIEDRDIICSFVGSLTHPVRRKLHDIFKTNIMFTFIVSDWSIFVENDKRETFIDYTKRSRFTLCPRGYGAQSFRFYEALQLGSIPIYVHDDNIWLPFNNCIDYASFCITIHEKELKFLPSIIASISLEKCAAMQSKGREIYNEYFTLEATYNQIYKYLYELNNCRK